MVHIVGKHSLKMLVHKINTTQTETLQFSRLETRTPLSLSHSHLVSVYKGGRIYRHSQSQASACSVNPQHSYIETQI